MLFPVCGKVSSEANIRKITLIHWDAPEAKARVARLESLGYAARFENRTGPALLRKITADPPSAVVIDLSRLPAQGAEAAAALRAAQPTRRLPIVFVDGLPEKVMIVRQSLPDAVYSTWTHLAEDLPRAISRPPLDPVVPDMYLASFAGKSMASKLAIQPGQVIALLNAPPTFKAALEPLPKGVSFRVQMGDDCNLVVWFVRSRRELQDGLELRAARLAGARLWILWSKKASGQSGDLSATSVRELGRAQGLASDKSISVDADWTGLLLGKDEGPST